MGVWVGDSAILTLLVNQDENSLACSVAEHQPPCLCPGCGLHPVASLSVDLLATPQFLNGTCPATILQILPQVLPFAWDSPFCPKED